VHPGDNRFAFEFFYSGMSVVDVVLPINGIDQGVVSRSLFCPQSGVRVGGGRAGGTVTTDGLVSISASGVQIAGS
jgi:hypothetical protein